jgi:hypothetical protein
MNVRSWERPFDYNFIPFKIDYDGEISMFQNVMHAKFY